MDHLTLGHQVTMQPNHELSSIRPTKSKGWTGPRAMYSMIEVEHLGSGTRKAWKHRKLHDWVTHAFMWSTAVALVLLLQLPPMASRLEKTLDQMMEEGKAQACSQMGHFRTWYKPKSGLLLLYSLERQRWGEIFPVAELWVLCLIIPLVQEEK